MKEVCRALPVAERERRMHPQGTLLYFRIWYKPELVAHQSSGNGYGHIYTPFGSGGGNGREGKSSCGLMPQTATATGGLRPEQGSSHFSAGDTVLSQGWHIPEDLHFYSAYLRFVSHGSFLHTVCPARTLCKDARAPRLLYPSPSRCTGAPGSQRLPVPRPEGSGTLPALTAAREWLVWKCPLLSEECIKAICCAARALLGWHLNKHSAGQRLHRVTPSLPGELCSTWS